MRFCHLEATGRCVRAIEKHFIQTDSVVVPSVLSLTGMRRYLLVYAIPCLLQSSPIFPLPSIKANINIGRRGRKYMSVCLQTKATTRTPPTSQSVRQAEPFFLSLFVRSESKQTSRGKTQFCRKKDRK